MVGFRVVAPLLACVSAAFNRDFYDEQRRLTRVRYDPSVRSTSVSTHLHGPAGRRLAAPDVNERPDDWKPASDQADLIMVVANPDELYFHQYDDRIVIYGTEVTLEDHMWSPDRDLEIMAAKINLPSKLTFTPKANWTQSQRTLHLHAHQIVVPEGGCEIDASGAKGWTANSGFPASMGSYPGARGRSGEDGGVGGLGGTVKIEAGSISGGILHLNVNGGVGGKGQDGGDGQMGAVGQRRDDIDNCCNRKRTRDNSGNSGMTGGNSGMGGNGGRGGTAGHATVLVFEGYEGSDPVLNNDGSHPNVVVTGSPGAGGAAGLPGKYGEGGAGGPGVMTRCQSVDIFWWNKMCTFPIGEEGPEGQNGTAAEPAAPGKPGAESSFGVVEVASASLIKLRANSAGQNMRYELFQADKLFRSSSFADAQLLYAWIEATIHTNHTNVPATFPWEQMGLDASVSLSKIKSGLDFWGRQLDHAPLLSFDALHDTVQSMLRIAKGAETAFDKYYEETTTEAERKSLIVKATKNLDFEISQKDAELHALKEVIHEARGVIFGLQTEQNQFNKLIQDHAVECDAGISAANRKTKFQFMPTVNRLIGIGQSTWKVVGIATAAVAAGLGIWGLLAAQVPAAVNSLSAGVQSLTGAASSGGDLIAAASSGVTNNIASVETIIATTVDARAEATNTWDQLSQAYSEVETFANGDATAIDSIEREAQIATTPEAYVEVRSQYLDSVAECEPIRGHYRSLVSASDVRLNKIHEHDMHVVDFATIAVDKSKLEAERADLHASVDGKFDPTALQFMQSIGEAYRAQKDRIIEFLKLLHESVDYEFCADNPFTYEDVRVTQLESILASISADRMRRHTEDSSARGVLAKGQDAVAIIKLRSSDSDAMLLAFQNYWETGTFSYSLDADNAALPSGVANMRIVNAQAFVPALLITEDPNQNSIAEVWLRRLGASTCTAPSGTAKLFSHAATGYLSVYSAEADPRQTNTQPVFMTAPLNNVDVVGPTPVGPWQVSVPSLTTQAQRSRVTELDLHLTISYVPCSSPGCGAQATAAASAVNAHSKKSNDKVPDTLATVGVGFTVFGVAALSSLVTAVGLLGFGRRTRPVPEGITLAAPQTSQ